MAEIHERVSDILIECDLLGKCSVLINPKSLECSTGTLDSAVWSLEKVVYYLKASQMDLQKYSPETSWEMLAGLISKKLARAKTSGNELVIAEEVEKITRRTIPVLEKEMRRILAEIEAEEKSHG